MWPQASSAMPAEDVLELSISAVSIDFVRASNDA